MFHPPLVTGPTQLHTMATRPKKPRPARTTPATEERGEELTAAGKRGNEQPAEPITEGDHDGTGMGVSDSEEWESDDGLCEYERRRMRNIRENRALMASLNLLKAKEDFGTAGKDSTHSNRSNTTVETIIRAVTKVVAGHECHDHDCASRRHIY